MDFVDPIADLLSEGSNDSFFEDPKPSAKKTTPKKIKSKSAVDIFGLDDEKPKKEQPKNDDWLGLSSTKEHKSEVDLTQKKSEVTFETDDVASILGTSAEQKRASKKSILSELLDDKSEKKTSFDDLLHGSVRKKEQFTATSSISVPEIKTQPQTHTEYQPILGRESRRTRRNSPSLIDPLGLFETETKDAKSSTLLKDVEPEKPFVGKKSTSQTTRNEPPPSISTNKSKSLEILPNNPPQIETQKSDIPDWLSGAKPKQKQETSDAPIPSLQTTTEPPRSHIPEDTGKQLSSNNILESVLTQQKISSSHLELQNASIALQQQESQLMIALQLKKYEEKLTEMQRKQEDMLVKQDIHFNSLLEKQFSKQQMIENTMRLQQERINNHIQLLMSQPTSSFVQETLKKDESLKNTLEEHRKFYQEIVESLKQKHQEEIFLLEESYKKQLQFLENSLESTETRLKSDIDTISKHFSAKLEQFEEEKQKIISNYEEKLRILQEANRNEIEVIKNSYKNTIEDVRNEYKSMLEDFSKQKMKEGVINEQNEAYNFKLNENIEILTSNTKTIGEIKQKLTEEYNILEDVKTEALNAKEMELKMMQSSLEKQRNVNDAERAQMIALIKSLQTRLAEQTQNAREERWAFQQANATLAARSLALDRESEFVKSNLEREREQIKTLKESLLAEHEAMLMKLTEEKLALAAEKAKLETSNKLSKNFDEAKAHVEIDAALKVAREATEMTDKERENLCRQQSELEIMKRSIQDQHQKLIVRERDLENLLKSAEQKYKDGERALNEARAIEYKYNEKLKDIQKQLVLLSEREKKLTEEKIMLSKERLSIRNTRKESNKLLSETDKYRAELDSRKEQISEINTHWNTDVEILRLKYDLQNEMEASKDLTLEENKIVG